MRGCGQGPLVRPHHRIPAPGAGLALHLHELPLGMLIFPGCMDPGHACLGALVSMANTPNLEMMAWSRLPLPVGMWWKI